MATPRDVDDAVAVMERNWRAEGYTSPNLETYPWQWLWDSCFHALIWARLGDARALTELESVFAFQRRHGFVPHMNYQPEPSGAVPLWGIEGSSTITQPPMYAHAARGLAAAGFDLPRRILEAIEAGLEHLWEARRHSNGLLSCFHPWEAGTDDSPRWDAWTSVPFDRFGAWRERKAELVAALQLDAQDAAVGSTEFIVQPSSFNALTAFNYAEFADLTGSEVWRRRGTQLSDALDERWDPELLTWTDTTDPPSSSGAVRTLEALAGALVTEDRRRAESVFDQLLDPAAYGAPFGPCGVHRDEPVFDPDAYWRGASWPQLTYLLWVAAERRGAVEVATRLADALRAGARTSGHAEYWNPDTGRGHGAAPQSWTTLWLVAHGQDMAS
jgi:glycogen debranching enzyme